MLSRWLPVEKPLVELEEQIAELKRLNEASHLDKSEEIAVLEQKRIELMRQVFTDLSPWDNVLMARHPKRPYTLDYLNSICSSFVELHGDRCFGDDPAMVAGFADLGGKKVVIVGQQKGRNTRERQYRNFGSARAEGYRKALRVMKLAEKFHKPVLCLVDTPCAACLAEAEERGISEAIARNQKEMSLLRVPVVVMVIGEGGSGGAIGIAVGNKVIMLEHAIYSVIPPEGCAAIIWRDANKGPEAAAALKLTAEDALKLGVADEILPEPLGGAHQNFEQIAQDVKLSLLKSLEELEPLSPDDLVEQRYQRFRKIGVFTRSTG